MGVLPAGSWADRLAAQAARWQLGNTRAGMCRMGRVLDESGAARAVEEAASSRRPPLDWQGQQTRAAGTARWNPLPDAGSFLCCRLCAATRSATPTSARTSRPASAAMRATPWSSASAGEGACRSCECFLWRDQLHDLCMSVLLASLAWVEIKVKRSESSKQGAGHTTNQQPD